MRYWILIACAVPLLTGCASYRPAPISAMKNANAIEARSLSDARLQKFIAAALATSPQPAVSALRDRSPPAWGLTRLTLAAVYYHPRLDLARAELAAAEAAVITARQVPNPSLSFEELSYNLSVPTPSPWTVAPVINFLIETFGKREFRTGKARALLDAARADLATASWQVRTGVRNALLNLWAAQHRVALLRQKLVLQNELVALLEERFAVGQASALDVARERTARNQIGLAIRAAERQGVDALTRLAAAVGVARQAVKGISPSFRPFERPERLGRHFSAGELRREALVGRSDVQGLLAEYAAAESALRLQIAKQYPDITLGPGYGYSQGQNMFLLLPAVDLPVFNQNQGPIAEALARRQEAAARFIALQTEIIDAIDGAAASYRAANQALATANRLLAGERDRAHRMQQSFAAGQVDRAALLTARIERITAEQSRFETLVAQRQALGAVEDALQHPFFGPALSAGPETSPRTAPTPGL